MLAHMSLSRESHLDASIYAQTLSRLHSSYVGIATPGFARTIHLALGGPALSEIISADTPQSTWEYPKGPGEVWLLSECRILRLKWADLKRTGFDLHNVSEISADAFEMSVRPLSTVIQVSLLAEKQPIAVQTSERDEEDAPLGEFRPGDIKVRFRDSTEWNIGYSRRYESNPDAAVAQLLAQL